LTETLWFVASITIPVASMIFKLIVHVAVKCGLDYIGWRVALDVIIMMLTPCINISYFMKNIYLQEEVVTLKKKNDEATTVDLTCVDSANKKDELI
jgi:hypothetical protein